MQANVTVSVIRHWTDEHGRKVVDTAYFPTGEHEERNGRSGAMHISDGESEISLNYSEMTTNRDSRLAP